jgi:hypothetical protein
MAAAHQSNDPRTRPAAKPPLPGLWAVMALGFVPAIVLFFLTADLNARELGLIFLAGIGIHCLRLRRRGRSAAAAGFTGAWLLPLTIILYGAVTAGFPWPWSVADLLIAAFWLPIAGLFWGFLTGKLFETAFFLGSCFLHWLRRSRLPSTTAHSLSDRIDEASTPLEAPPSYGLPRRFGIRGLLIAVTWASVLMGCLRSWGATPGIFFVVLTFVTGVLIAQVLLFRGRDPLTASMWAGSFLLPCELFVLGWANYREEVNFFNQVVGPFAMGCICLVPAGIILGGLAGRFCGMIYAVSDSLLLWISRGLPEIELAPIAEADSDVLLAWIRGPKLCQRWAGDQLTYPLDEKLLLERFATTSGEKPVRLIFKAVDAHTGSMIGYVEIGRINHLLRRARLELPLLDPTASERGRLGVLLLRRTAEKAFRELGLLEISVFSHSDQSEFAACCKRAWAMGYDFFSYWNEVDGVWLGRLRRGK